VLVSDLYEGGVKDALVRRMAAMVRSGVTCIVLLALSDDGAPSYDSDHAAALAAVGVPALVCTPDAFADLISAAIDSRDITGSLSTWRGSGGPR